MYKRQGQNVQQAQRGLWMNALLKIPMQFFILLTGVLVFVFYLFNAAPIHWNSTNLQETRAKDGIQLTQTLEAQHTEASAGRSEAAHAWVDAIRGGHTQTADSALTRLQIHQHGMIHLEAQYHERLKHLLPDAEANDKDYIFITFIMDHMPIGIIGLLLAMIFSAGMSSTSAELSALATTSVVDVVKKERTDGEQVRATKWATVLFGLLALAFAALFSLFENLIQAVNIIGSLFYGTILGIFLVAFFLKRVGGTAVFVAALVAQATILALHFSHIEIAFLWYNLIAPAIVVVLAAVIHSVIGTPGHIDPEDF